MSWEFCLYYSLMSSEVGHWFERQGSHSADWNGSQSFLKDSGEEKKRSSEEEKVGPCGYTALFESENGWW